MLSKIVSFPVFMALIAVLYLIWEKGEEYVIYLVPIVILLAVLYILSPQIDWFLYKRRPPEMYPQLKQMLQKRLPFYSKLNAKYKKRFESRVMLYMLANQFLPQLMDTVPKDAEALVAANVVQLTFGVPDFRMPAFENIVMCPGPFPSPQYPEHNHVAEIFAEDKSILLSMDHAIHGTINAKKNYNIALHEYARVYMLVHPEIEYPTLPADIWKKLELISGFTEQYIRDHIGRPDVQALPTCMVCFFIFPEKFWEVEPKLFRELSRVFNLNPMNGGYPVVDVDLMGADAG